MSKNEIAKINKIDFLNRDFKSQNHFSKQKIRQCYFSCRGSSEKIFEATVLLMNNHFFFENQCEYNLLLEYSILQGEIRQELAQT